MKPDFHHGAFTGRLCPLLSAGLPFSKSGFVGYISYPSPIRDHWRLFAAGFFQAFLEALG